VRWRTFGAVFVPKSRPMPLYIHPGFAGSPDQDAEWYVRRAVLQLRRRDHHGDIRDNAWVGRSSFSSCGYCRSQQM
jgi:hypothetical protein